MLPEPGSVPVDVEVQARLKDFAFLQLRNESAPEFMELAALVEGTGDWQGRLAVVNRLRSAKGATIALVVQYRASFPMGGLADGTEGVFDGFKRV